MDLQVGKITNIVSFKVDQNSYNRALKAIKRIAGAWSQATSKMSKSMDIGRRMSGNSGGTRGRTSSVMGPPEFSPGKNTIMIEKRAKQEAKSVEKAARIRASAEAKAAKSWAARRKQAIKDLTGTSGTKASGTLFADMLRGEAKKMSGPMGPQPFSPGQNTRNQQKASRQEASRLERASATISLGEVGRGSAFSQKYADQIKQLNSELKSGVIKSTAEYNKKLNLMSREFRNASQQGKGLFGTLHDIRGEFVALTATYTAFAGGKAVMQTGQMFESIESAMSISSANTAETAANMEYIRGESYRLGLDLKTAAEGFAQLRIGSRSFMDSSQAQELFTGFSEYAKVAGIDAFRFEKSMLGLIQVANKGQLMAEDVKGQIFENMVGSQDAFLSVANQLAGKDGMMDMEDFLDQMQKGKFLAKDFLPLLGKYFSETARAGGKLAKRLLSNEVAMMRLKTTWMDFQDELFKAGFGEALTKWFNQLASMMKSNAGFAKEFGAALGAVMDQLLDKFTMIYDYILIFWLEFKYYILDSIPDGIKDIIKEFGAWAIAVGILYKSFSGLFKILGAIAGLGGLSKVLGIASFIAQLNPIIRGLIVAAGLVKFLMDMKETADKGPRRAVGISSVGNGQTNNWMGGSNYVPVAAANFGFKPPVTAPATSYGGGSSSTAPTGQVNIKVDEGKLKDFIKVEINDNNNNFINLTSY